MSAKKKREEKELKEYRSFNQVKIIPSPWNSIEECIVCGSETEDSICENPSCPRRGKRGEV